ncbi:MAG TPA: hypothetical protein VHR66_10600 [Gemmataceae bacterium]|nr:hypothetical protein [Gemmataceae bacterium]
MDTGPLLDRVLDDEGLTAGLDAAAATELIRAVSACVRTMASTVKDEAIARQRTDELCRQARQIASTARASAEPLQVIRRLIGTWTG